MHSVQHVTSRLYKCQLKQLKCRRVPQGDESTLPLLLKSTILIQFHQHLFMTHYAWCGGN